MRNHTPFRLDGKVAIITGASRGIGRAIALVLADAGADVVLAARNMELLMNVAQEIEKKGREALVVKVDVKRTEEVELMADEAIKRFEHIDILVNNAGIGEAIDIQSLTEESWREMLETNLTGAFRCVKTIIPHMIKQRWGRIINISSISAFTGGLAGGAHYSASKGALVSMSKTLARDLAPYNITVNTIAPGQIATRMGVDQYPPEKLKALYEMIPLGRLGKPEDVAYGVLYLSSEEAGYITGATLDINGGILKR